jgi:hypothetical protein
MKRKIATPPNLRPISWRQSNAARDSWLVLNLRLFNFAGGSSHLLGKQQVRKPSK